MSKGTIIGLSVGVVAIIVIIFMFMGGGSWSDETKNKCSCIKAFLKTNPFIGTWNANSPVVLFKTQET